MTSEQPVEITEETLTAAQRNLPPKHMIILKFTAEWCGPCKVIKPICEEYRQNFPKSIFYHEIDIDESIELYMKLKRKKMVNGIPALLAFHSGEQDLWYVPSDSQLGGNKEKVREFFDRCITHVS